MEKWLPCLVTLHHLTKLSIRLKALAYRTLELAENTTLNTTLVAFRIYFIAHIIFCLSVVFAIYINIYVYIERKSLSH